MIRFACPGCASTFSVPDEKAGKSGKCPKCQSQFVIPQAEGTGAAPPLPANAPAPGPPPISISTIQLPVQTALDPNAPVEIDPCPKCQTKLSVSVSDLGNDVECPYCKTVFKSERAGTRPPAPPPAPGKVSNTDADFSGRPKSRRKDADDEDDRPRKRRRDDDEDDDRPAKRRRRDDDEEDDRPSRRRAVAGRDDDDEDDRPSRRGRAAAAAREDDEEDDRPSRRRRSSRRDDDDEDDYDDRPRRRSRGGSRRGGGGQKSIAVTLAGAFTILVGVLWLIGAATLFFGGAFFMSVFGGLPRQNMNPGGQAAADTFTAVFIGCGFILLLVAIVHLMGGVFAIQRKGAGRVMVIICATLGIILGLFGLWTFFRLLTLPFTPPIEAVLYQLLSLLLTLGYGIFALIVMCRPDCAEEFD